MKGRGYQIFGATLLLLYSFVELTGRELSGGDRAFVPPGARNARGYRSFYFWNGGK